MLVAQELDGHPVQSDYVIVFRVHFWDDYARRQFARLQAHAAGADIYILVDETNGAATGIEHDKIVRITEQDVVAQGFARAGEGGLFWFNGDYPLYYFRQLCGQYRYYLCLEYDVVLNVAIDAFMRAVMADGTDFVGLTKGDPPPQWLWSKTCLDTYRLEDVRSQLISLSVFSGRALDLLAERRLEQSRARREGDEWPYCEGFVPTELALNGMTITELSRYGSTDGYDHWPPFLETELATLSGYPFVHPVLDQDRYVASMLKWPIGLKNFLNVNSLVHRKLRRLPLPRYVGAISSGFSTRVARRVQRARQAIAGGRLSHSRSA